MASQKFQLDDSLSLDDKLRASWLMKITVGILGCYLTKLPGLPKPINTLTPSSSPNYMASSGCKDAVGDASCGATGATTDSARRQKFG